MCHAPSAPPAEGPRDCDPLGQQPLTEGAASVWTWPDAHEAHRGGGGDGEGPRGPTEPFLAQARRWPGRHNKPTCMKQRGSWDSQQDGFPGYESDGAVPLPMLGPVVRAFSEDEALAQQESKHWQRGALDRLPPSRRFCSRRASPCRPAWPPRALPSLSGGAHRPGSWAGVGQVSTRDMVWPHSSWWA